MALYMQNTLGYSTYKAGLVFLALTLVWGGMSPYGGKITDIFGARTPIITGMIVTAVATFLFAQLTPSSATWELVIVFLITGVGFGLAFPALNTLVMQAVPEEDISLASGGFVSLGMLCNSAALVVGSLYYTHASFLNTLYVAAKQGMPFTQAQFVNLKVAMANTHFDIAKLTAFKDGVKARLVADIHFSYVTAMNHIMYVCVGLALGGVLVSLLMIKKDPKKKIVS